MASRVVSGVRVDHNFGRGERCRCRNCMYARAEAASVRRLLKWQKEGAAERTTQWEGH